MSIGIINIIMRHELEKFYILGFIPILYKERCDNKYILKLFKFFPVASIYKDRQNTSVKILGIPIFKKKTKSYCSSWSYRLIRFLLSLPTKRNAVLIVDNIYESNCNIVDNFTLFEYLCKSSTKKLQPYYIVSKQSQYYFDLKEKYGRRIIGFPGVPTPLMKLKLFFISLKLKYVCDSYQSISYLFLNFAHAVKKSKKVFSIFTQHGVTYFKPYFITPNTYGINNFDFVMVSNDFEKEIFAERGKFPKTAIIDNGLFRWEYLENKSSPKNKSILIYFTKRGYINNIKNVESSSYIQSIINILNHEYWESLLKKYNLKIKLGLHHSVAQKIEQFVNIKNVELINEDEIENIKQEASLLLTDYSSMCFEFFLQNKPVIFYHIDDSADCKLYGKKEDIINPFEGKEEELFNIKSDVNEAIRLIEKYAKNNFQCEKEIIDKENKFFYFKNNFCERFEKFLLEHLEDSKK